MAKIERATKGSIGKEYFCGECHRRINPGEEYFTWQPDRGSAHLRCAAHEPDELEAELIMVKEAAEDGYRASTLRHIEQALKISQAQVLSEMRAALLEARDAVEERGPAAALPDIERAIRVSQPALVPA